MLTSYEIICLVLLIYSIKMIVLKSEEDEKNNNELETKKQVTASSFQVPDEIWTSMAIKEIAHYCRNYKFNEWDQRYFSEKPEQDIGYYDSFPIPTVKSLHWKVYKNCENNFYKCITYLHSVIQMTMFRRNDDVVTYLNENFINNVTLTKILNFECMEIRFNSERSNYPFDSPKEKFQWRTTASYFMCWYTMLGTPALSMVGDRCDNFANCLDPIFGQRNHDPRSDDRLSFACAMYSFCPDPCCPLKHIHNLSECYKNTLNVCLDENHDRHINHKKCVLDKKENCNFEGIVSNKWNVSCHCKRNGFKWKSELGMCVDINECLDNQSLCHSQAEDCLNTLGSYKCICKFQFELDSNKNKCILSNTLLQNTGSSSLSPDNESIVDSIVRYLNYIGIKTY